MSDELSDSEIMQLIGRDATPETLADIVREFKDRYDCMLWVHWMNHVGRLGEEEAARLVAECKHVPVEDVLGLLAQSRARCDERTTDR